MTALRRSLPTRPQRHRARLAAALLGAALLPWAPGPARALEGPKGKVVLSITGKVAGGNAGERADFDMAMLEALPQQSFTAETPWFKAPRKFSGPLLRDVMAAAGARGQILQAVALNDYKVEIPFEDIEKFKVVLATRLDGQPMAVRDKGPLFIIYPFHESATLRSERYYSRSAWQLRTIDVK